MPRDPKRRSRRSLPSAIERNLSLHELLGDDDAASRRHATRRKSLEKQQQQELQSLNAYFAMIDGTELKVEKQDPTAAAADEAATSASSSDAEAGERGGAVSDSELVRPTVSAKSRTQRTLRRRNLEDAKLQAEYADYCDATASAGKPVSIEVFARTIVPQVKTGMYDGVLDMCAVEEPQSAD